MKRWGYIVLVLCILSLGSSICAGPPSSYGSGREYARIFDRLDAGNIPTGILYDRVIPLSGIERFDGSEAAPTGDLHRWKQIYFELSHAAVLGEVQTGSTGRTGESVLPDLSMLLEDARRLTTTGTIPIAFLNYRYNQIKPDALEKGLLRIRDGRLVETHEPFTTSTGGAGPYLEARVFAVAPLKEHTYRGRSVLFSLDADRYLTNDERPVTGIEIDFDDGRGLRPVRFDGSIRVAYESCGRRIIRTRLTLGDGAVLGGSFYFDVRQLQAPTPDDTLHITATIPYNGEYGTGDAWILLSDRNTELTFPVVILEGFDINNDMFWDELHFYLNQEGMLDSILSEGLDVVVLNFTDATDYLQKNSFVTIELIQQVLSMISIREDIALIGASMGGLVGRYTLTYMEANALEHRVRTFISFDSPQRGANIPLGLQYWTMFFAEQSEEAAANLERLNRPAARQMLVYHFTDPHGTTGEADSLRQDFLADLAGLGSYPANLRKVAVANGSGIQTGQGFAPGEQIILYEYSSLLVDIIGNVWALPDGTNQIIFDGLIDLIWPLPDTELQVYVSGTLPYDNAPGGWRASMAQVDSSEAPYGDIIALHDAHCFIPTVSALDLDTSDLFYDIAGDPGIMSLTPFDTIYYPIENQEHMAITAESAPWFLGEVLRGVVAVDDIRTVPKALVLHQNFPNPFNPTTTIRFELPGTGRVNVSIFAVDGRRVATLFDGKLPAGPHSLVWDGRDVLGRRTASGIYFYRVTAGLAGETRKMVLLR
ncbi:MAG: T9SS type A sorting domain-containing protein [bacterium]|nr:MAG: T9SS type A sorting domain-containing protein [bacterium]